MCRLCYSLADRGYESSSGSQEAPSGFLISTFGIESVPLSIVASKQA